MARVSIITPLFNRATVLEQTADSVKAQTHSDWEWIVVDDGSTDGGQDLVRAWAAEESRIQLHIRDRAPKGACTCRNIGASVSSGDFLVFLDSDDVLTPFCLEQRLRHQLQHGEGPSVVPFFQTAIFEEDPTVGHLWDDADHPVGWLEGVLSMKPPCQSTGPLWSREAWEQVGGWNEELLVWQDIELHMRAHFQGIKFKSSGLTAVDFLHRVSADSISRVGFHSPEKLASRLAVVRYALAHHQSIQTEKERQALSGMVLSILRNLSHHGNWSEANALLEQAESSLEPDEIKLGRKLLWSRRWKLDRIPQVRRQIQRQWNETLPSSGRKLGRHRWIPHSP